jgi:hypothetical protein
MGKQSAWRVDANAKTNSQMNKYFKKMIWFGHLASFFFKHLFVCIFCLRKKTNLFVRKRKNGELHDSWTGKLAHD